MSDDVTIDRETASRIAAALRDLAGILGHGMGVEPLVRKWADLLDPPQPSLRDEVASVLLDNGWTCEYHEPDAYCGECRRLYAVTADAVLAVARERIAALPCCECKGRGQSSRHGVTDLVPCWVCDAGRATSPPISRRDVLALFGGDDE